MRYCDLTFAYTPTSGGIRTYLDQKKKFLLADSATEHVLIVPGEQDAVRRNGRATVYEVASPLIPGAEPYRCFVRPRVVLETLREAAPDVIELGTFFVEPWAAFRYREEMLATGTHCVVGGFFHTDLAAAYFGSPLREAMGETLASWSETVATWGTKLADLLETGAANYFGSLFRKCDLMCAATPIQVERLATYGIGHAHLVPLGVDLEQFHPRRRSPARRAALGADESALVLVYAGRLDREKHVHFLVDAFERLELRGKQLWLMGEGPERAALEQRAGRVAGLSVLPYQSETETLAEYLASADIYVTAGAHETFGLSIIEAQASGLPVVGVNSGALIERVAEGTGLLSRPGDVERFAQAIEKVAPDRAALGRAAREHVIAAGFGWERTFARWHEAYQAARSCPSLVQP